MDIEPFTDLKQAVDEIAFMTHRSQRLAGSRYGIFEKQSNQLIGTCGFNTWDRQSTAKAEIGYDLAKRCWGQGIMKEALNALLTLGFTEMNLYRVEALVLPGAIQSMSVLRKLGFTEEGVLRGYGYWLGQHWDDHMFSLLCHEWLK